MEPRPLESAGGPPGPGLLAEIPGRTNDRRGRAGTIARTVLLLGVLGLSAFNASWSPALRRMEAAEARGDFPAALTEALAHLERRPWSREAHLVAARCLSRLDFAELAEPHYLGRRPDLLDRHYRAYGLVRANFRERAIAAYDEILAIRPDDVAALRAQAGVLLASSRWADVARIGRRLADLPAGPAWAESPLGVGDHWTLRPARIESVPALGSTLEALARHDDGDPEPAVAAFERVIALDPEFRSMPLAPALFWGAFAADLVKVGRASEAIHYLQKATEGRDEPDLLLQLGNAHEQSGSIDSAEACWRKILERRADYPGAWLNLGRAALQRNEPEEAVRRLVRAQELLPGSYDVAYNLGLAYRRLGRDDLARKAEARADELRKRPDVPPSGPAAPPASPASKPPAV